MKREYAVIIIWSEEDQAYLAASELPGAIADGATPEEALHNLRLVVGDWIEAARKAGRSVPPASSKEDLARSQVQARTSWEQNLETAVRAAVQSARAQVGKTSPDRVFEIVRSLIVEKSEATRNNPGPIWHVREEPLSQAKGGPSEKSIATARSWNWVRGQRHDPLGIAKTPEAESKQLLQDLQQISFNLAQAIAEVKDPSRKERLKLEGDSLNPVIARLNEFHRRSITSRRA